LEEQTRRHLEGIQEELEIMQFATGDINARVNNVLRANERSSPESIAEEYYDFENDGTTSDDTTYQPPSVLKKQMTDQATRRSSRPMKEVKWYGNEQAREAQQKAEQKASRTKKRDIYVMALDKMRAHEVKVPRTFK
jgi:hypothetical protein